MCLHAWRSVRSCAYICTYIPTYCVLTSSRFCLCTGWSDYIHASISIFVRVDLRAHLHVVTLFVYRFSQHNSLVPFHLNTRFSRFFIQISQVVSTTLQPTLRYTGKDSILAYQMVQSSQIMQVNGVTLVVTNCETIRSPVTLFPIHIFQLLYSETKSDPLFLALFHFIPLYPTSISLIMTPSFWPFGSSPLHHFLPLTIELLNLHYLYFFTPTLD